MINLYDMTTVHLLNGLCLSDMMDDIMFYFPTHLCKMFITSIFTVQFVFACCFTLKFSFTNENTSAILDSPICYHMLTVTGRFFITVPFPVIMWWHNAPCSISVVFSFINETGKEPWIGHKDPSENAVRQPTYITSNAKVGAWEWEILTEKMYRTSWQFAFPSLQCNTSGTPSPGTLHQPAMLWGWVHGMG